MRDDNRKKIFDAVKRLAVAMGQQVTGERLQIYSEYLNRYEYDMVKKSLEKSFLSSKFFPSIAEIIEGIAPAIGEKDDAVEMAGAIMDAARSYSEYGQNSARAQLGETAWHAVEQFGGFDVLCRMTYEQEPTIRAQLRDLCKAILKREKINPNLLRMTYAERRKFSGAGSLKRLEE